MTFCELLIFTLVTGVISGVIATYLVRFLDTRHKNNRPESK